MTLSVAPQPAQAQGKEARVASAAAETPEERAKLFIELLKRRARRILEARRLPPPPILSASAGISEGYESNVNLNGARQGDYFTQEELRLVFRPRMTSWLQGEFAYDFFNSHYQELTDSNILVSNFASLLEVQPHPRLRLDLGHEYGIVNFPEDTSSSSFDHRLNAYLNIAHTSSLIHRIGWSHQLRNYDTRKALDAAGTGDLAVVRQDNRHTASYEARISLADTFLSVLAEFYRNFSNDRFEDFYDWNNLKLRALASRPMTERLTAVAAASYERRNYQHRNVPAIDMAERDNLYTLAGSLIADLKQHLQLVYTLTYRYQDSNDPTLDFTDVTHRVGLSASF